MAPSRRLLLAAPLALLACGDAEAEGRRALIAWLRARVIEPPGLRVPRPTAEETRSFGPYAEHYAVITSFHDAMDRSVLPPFREAVRAGAVRNLAEAMERRADLAAARDGAARLGATLDAELARAEAARAALRQPDDLRAVYALAYGKVVTTPATVFRQAFPVMEDGLTAALRLADALERNRDRVRVSGSLVEVRDPRLRAELDAMLTELNARSRAMQEMQRQLQGLVAGR